MATQISIGDALGAGVRIMQRKPLAPLVWGLVYFVCAYLPAMLTVSMMMPSFGAAMTSGAAPDPAKLAAMMGPIQLMNVVQTGFSIVGFALVNAAICRATFEPEKDRSFYLRVGAQELWQGLILAVTYVLIFIAAIAIMAPVIIISVVAGLSGARGGAGALTMIPLIVLLVFVAFAAIAFLWLRLSMALPMSFVHRQFRLFESWNFTKGNTLRLFGLAVLIFLVLLVAEIVVFTVLSLVGLGVFSAAGGPAMFQKMAGQPPSAWLSKLAIWIVPGAVIFSAVVGYMMTFAMAPWAAAYRQIAGPNYADVFSDSPAHVAV